MERIARVAHHAVRYDGVSIIVHQSGGRPLSSTKLSVALETLFANANEVRHGAKLPLYPSVLGYFVD